MASNFPPSLPPPFVFPLLDAGQGRAKKQLDFNRENYVLGALGETVALFPLVSIAQSQTNATVQSYAMLPCRTKIAKIGIFCSAISHTDGSILFNIVLGTGTYTSGTNAPGNDNSSVPNVSLRDSTTGQPTTISGGAGLCTNPATVGQSVFAVDVAFNTTNFPNLTVGTGTGATYGQILVPTSPDAVWPNSGVLTLRFTTPAAHTVTNLLICATLEPQPLSATYPSIPGALTAIPGVPVPNQDF